MSDKDWKIQIILEDKNVTPKRIENILQEVEHVLYLSDRSQIETFSREARLPEIIRDAALERLRRERGRRVVLSDIARGSFRFELVLLGVPIFVLLGVLKKCVVDGMIEGVKSSEFHKRLVEFTRQTVDENMNIILTKLGTGRFLRQARVLRDGKTIIIRLPEALNEDDRARPLSYYLDNESDGA